MKKAIEIFIWQNYFSKIFACSKLVNPEKSLFESFNVSLRSKEPIQRLKFEFNSCPIIEVMKLKYFYYHEFHPLILIYHKHPCNQAYLFLNNFPSRLRIHSLYCNE